MTPAPGPRVRVALDLLGGDEAPEAVVDGALLASDEQPGTDVVLVGPPDVAARLLGERGAAGRLEVVAASQVVGMTEDPARAVRSKRDATVRVAARLVRDGGADAMVSVGSTGGALAAAVFTLGRLRGVSRPALAVVVPSLRAPVVLLDAGAGTESTPELLVQHALAGVALAQVRLGLARPRLGLLTIGEEEGKGDALRRAAAPLLAALPVDYVGSVQGSDVPYGGAADVVVTDGFTGNVLAKGLEGATGTLRQVLTDAFQRTPQRRAAAGLLAEALEEATGAMSADAFGGAHLLGVKGVCVVGHGASSPRAVASCVAAAAEAVREGLVPRTARALADLLDARGSVAT